MDVGIAVLGIEGTFRINRSPCLKNLGFIPKILDTSSIDEIIQIANETAFSTAKMAAKIEGLVLRILARPEPFIAPEFLPFSEYFF